MQALCKNYSNLFRFCTTNTRAVKNSLNKNLYSIELITKSLNRRVLSMFYSPGVGAVCEAVQKDKNASNIMTMRGRSVAILTDGDFMNAPGKKVMPVIDWVVAQVKYYSGKEPFPFVVEKNANTE